MLGVVFTELVEMIEGELPAGEAEAVIQPGSLSRGGAYTALGRYPAEELVGIVQRLAAHSGQPLEHWLRAFGAHLLPRFMERWPALFEGVESAFDLLEGLEDRVHATVRRLYPQAELPRFEVRRDGDRELVLVYRSERAMADLARGLLEAAVAHWGEPMEIGEEDLSGGARTEVRFTLRSRSQ